MGHIRLGTLPKSREWQDVVALVSAGAEVDTVASAVATAAHTGFAGAPRDDGLVEALWLLLQLPSAARSDDFPAAREAVQHLDAESVAIAFGNSPAVVVIRTEDNGRRMLAFLPMYGGD
jgi:hypothetical protein